MGAPTSSQIILYSPANGTITPLSRGKGGEIEVKYSDIGKQIRIFMPCKITPETEIALNFGGHNETAVGFELEPTSKGTIISIPVSEFTMQGIPGLTHRIIIRPKGGRIYSVTVRLNPTDLSQPQRPATAATYYQAVFHEMQMSGTPTFHALHVVFPDIDGSSAEKDQFWSGGHGAHIVYDRLSKGQNPRWREAGKEQALSSGGENAREAAYKTTVYPPDFQGKKPAGAYVLSGEMLAAYHHLPEGPLKQKIRQQGITVTLYLRYYPDTILGYRETLGSMHTGIYSSVQVQGHRYFGFPAMARNFGLANPGLHGEGMAYFGNHCQSSTSDDPVLRTAFTGIYIPVTTRDSVHGAAQINHTVLESLITGEAAEPDQLTGRVAKKYEKDILKRPGVGVVYTSSPKTYYNPDSDPDRDGLPGRLDPEPNIPNKFSYAKDTRDLTISTANGYVKVHIYVRPVAPEILEAFGDRLKEHGYIVNGVIQSKITTTTIAVLKTDLDIEDPQEARDVLSQLQKAHDYTFSVLQNPNFVKANQPEPPKRLTQK